jgi:P-type Ca2+ transporter type 2C
MVTVATNNQLTQRGLTATEAETRLKQFGPNTLPEKPPKKLWQRFLTQFQSPLIYILLFALVTDIVIWVIEGAGGLPFESFAIALILLLNAGLGVYQESKAETALARLKSLSEAMVWVLRDGFITRQPATTLVPGDVVRVEAGDRVPADGRIIEIQGIMLDESVLTGESLPVEKEIGDEAFSGTLLVRGKGYLAVTRTGAESTMGKLATMIGNIETEKTPLERRLADFGKQIARWILMLAFVIALGGLFVEGFARIGHVLLFTVALAVAVVPEGLPAILTLTLSRGVERMAKRKAIVRRLSAVEALGSVTVIATDKTGTLTENRMHVKAVDCLDTKRSLLAMTLANDAEADTGAGDPLELALFDYARAEGIEIEKVKNIYPRKSLLPFDSSYKYMRVTVDDEGRLLSYLKGAPEVLLKRSLLGDTEQRSWEEKAEAYAAEGFRVLALGWREGEGDEGINFLGLALLWDPPRDEVPQAIQQAQAAGIRVVMVTGDHPSTALAVANEVGIQPGRVVTGLDLETLSQTELVHAVKESNVFARVTPEDKLRLVEALKASGEIVAVTGDGVNDAPALKRSDVGVAMGKRGSDVSREVADLVLLDDNFATIVAAIEEGRNIYENIQKFIRFLFSTNLSEVLIMVVGVLGSILLGLRDEAGGLLLPLTAAQLLWVNIITDGPPALALGLDRNHGLMRQRPRAAQSPLLDSAALRFILIAGTAKTLAGGAILIALPRYGYSLNSTRTLLFLFMTIGQLVFAYPSRRISAPPKLNITLHLAVILGVGLQLLTIFLPQLRLLLGLDLWVAGTVMISWGVAEFYARLSTRARVET